MRITIVMGFFLPVPAVAGGATEKIWHRLGELMAEQGHDVTLVSRRWPGLAECESKGRVTHLRLRGTKHSRYLPLNLLLDFFWGWRVFRALPPGDVVICNTVSLPIYLRRLKPRAGRVAVVLGRMPKGQCRFYGGVNLALATGTAVAGRAIRENPTLAAKTHLFPNPIDWTALSAASRTRSGGHPLVIGFVGRIHPEKGLEFLLAAAALLTPDSSLPAWRIAIIGPTVVAQGGGGETYRTRLQASLSPALTRLVRWVEPEYDEAKLAAHYAAIDIFCYPSVAEHGETFGIALAEAMAAGCAPVVSALACFRDLVEPGQTGLVFDHAASDSAVQLAAHLKRLLMDSDERRQIAARAQAHVRRFDFAACARVVLDCIRQDAPPPDMRAPASPPQS